MTDSESTCWSLIEGAASGSAADREQFARHYAPVIRAYLAARWRGTPGLSGLDDAVQEVFVECFRRRGVLERAERERPGGFRPFLYGVARNVARRFEARHARHGAPAEQDLEAIADDEPSLSRAFDQAWARTVLREAAARQEAQARRAGPAGEAALRRVELLRLRFHEGLAIREIAHRWQTDAAALHHEYAKARQEFKDALRQVVAFHHGGSDADVEQECVGLLGMLK